MVQGYAEYLTSAFAEWTLGLSFLAFTLTFILELRHSEMEWEGVELVGRLQGRIDEYKAQWYHPIDGETVVWEGDAEAEILDPGLPRMDTLLGTPYPKQHRYQSTEPVF